MYYTLCITLVYFSVLWSNLLLWLSIYSVLRSWIWSYSSLFIHPSEFGLMDQLKLYYGADLVQLYWKQTFSIGISKIKHHTTRPVYHTIFSTVLFKSQRSSTRLSTAKPFKTFILNDYICQKLDQLISKIFLFITVK